MLKLTATYEIKSTASYNDNYSSKDYECMLAHRFR